MPAARPSSKPHQELGATATSAGANERDKTIPGSIKGGLKAATTNKARYGEDFYRKIGTKGGQNSHGGGFSPDYVYPNGMTGLQMASIAGSKGGKASRRRAAIKPQPEHEPQPRFNIVKVLLRDK